MRANFVVILSGLVLVSGVLGCSTASSKPRSSHQQASTARPLWDAYLLYEMDKLDAAEQKLQAILKAEPDNPAAGYLLNLVREAQYREQPKAFYPTLPPQLIYR
jgi:predicted Zn-dependent protease